MFRAWLLWYIAFLKAPEVQCIVFFKLKAEVFNLASSNMVLMQIVKEAWLFFEGGRGCTARYISLAEQIYSRPVSLQCIQIFISYFNATQEATHREELGLCCVHTVETKLLNSVENWNSLLLSRMSWTIKRILMRHQTHNWDLWCEKDGHCLLGAKLWSMLRWPNLFNIRYWKSS